MGGGQSGAPSKPEVIQSNELRIAMKYQWKLRGITAMKTFVSGMLSVIGEKSLRIWQNTRVLHVWKQLYSEKHYRTGMFLGAINLHRNGLKIANVLASLPNKSPSSLMKQINGNDVNTVQVFEAHFSHKHNEPLDLLMYAQPLTEDFVYVLRDSSLKNQLWKAYVDGLYDPDVVVKVSGHCLSVHKSILIARSPVLATKIQQGESSIDFKDVDVPTVERFLKFLYTGTLDGSFASEKLLLLAKNYKVYTLEKACKMALEKVDQKEIGKIMSSMRNVDSTKEKSLV